jgi:glycerol-3-phosphate dehydrogenase subunit B
VKCDFIIIGAELESLAAALRLAAEDARIRLLMPGAGSLHYAPGALSLLAADSTAPTPFDAMSELDPRHPYRILGTPYVRSAVEWFLSWVEQQGRPWICSGRNIETITMAGNGLPAFAFPDSLATCERLAAKNVAIVAFEQHADFLPQLCARGLAASGVNVSVLRLKPPAEGDSVRIARAFDHCERSYFEAMRRDLPADADIAVFPALLGLERPAQVREMASDALAVDILEVATLPPSVFGLRLYRMMMRALTSAGVLIHPNVRHLRAKMAEGVCRGLVDEHGHEYHADRFILATGGIMMGGLDVQSHGDISEPVFGLDVHQTRPLSISDAVLVPDALHQAGVIVDERLRPTIGGKPIANVHAAGAVLAHWNPVEELSNEGVAIATGRAAADFALGKC